MPQLTIEDHGTFEVPYGRRLVLAIEDSGFDNLHRCGGYAKCTTCRVVFLEGEPDRMTVAERERLMENEVLGQFRLSCQCLVTHDMRVQPLMRLSTSGLDDAGPRPEEHITPEPEWA
jgi:ferredoxin